MKLKAQDILPTHEQLPDDLYRRLLYYVDNYCLRHDLLYQYGWGHLLLACYAAFPAHLSPDLLHKIRLNFRHYQQLLPPEEDPKPAEDKKPKIITREIPLVAVSDLLLSNLLRETGFERFEMPEALRHYLLWLYQHSGIFAEKCKIFPIPPTADSQALSPESARLDSLADFLKYYADEHYTASDPITRSLREAQKWTAEAWQNPGKAATFLRERLSNATKPTELYHFSRLGNRLGVQYDLQLNAKAENAPDSFEPLRTYARGVSSLYEGKVSQAIETLGGADQLIATELNAATAPGAVRLPVPREVAKELLKQRPELLEKQQGLKPREWASLEARLRSPWPKAVLTIDDGDRVEIAQRLISLEKSLRQLYQDPSLRLADFFDIIAGSGLGAVMAALAVSVKHAEEILSLLRLQENPGDEPQFDAFLREYFKDQRFPNETFRNGLMIGLNSYFDSGLNLYNNLTTTKEDSSVLLFDLLSKAINGTLGLPQYPHSTYDGPANNLNLTVINAILDQEATFNWNISPEQFLFVFIQADLPPEQSTTDNIVPDSTHQFWQQVRWMERHHLDLLKQYRMRVVEWDAGVGVEEGTEGEVLTNWPEAWRVAEITKEAPASNESPLDPNREKEKKIKTGPAKVFISYAREDQPYLEELKKWLHLFEIRGVMQVWYDGRITAGENWENAIKENLLSADIVLLLITADFFVSDNNYNELKIIIERHQSGEITAIPIIIKNCLWQESAISSLEVLPKKGIPISNWPHTAGAWNEVCEGIEAILEQKGFIKPLQKTNPSPARPALTIVPTSSIPKFVMAYDWEDEAFSQELNKALAPLTKMGRIRISNTLSDPNEDIAHTKSKLADADYILVFVSVNLFSNNDLYPLVRDAMINGRRVIPVLIHELNLAGTGFENLPSLPSGGRSIQSFPNLDEAYFEIVSELRDLLPESSTARKMK